MDEKSSDSTKDEVVGVGIGESRTEKLAWGWPRDIERVDFRDNVKHIENSELSEDDVGGRARVTTGEELCCEEAEQR